MIKGEQKGLLIVWESTLPPPQSDSTVYTWNGHRDDGTVRSVLRYAEANGDRLRQKYLRWVHDLGEHRVRDRRVVEHLALTDGLSFWWTTLFVEKSPWKMPVIMDAVKLLALEEIVASESPSQLMLVSGDARLHQVIRGLCAAAGIPYKWRRTERPSRGGALLRAFRALPMPVQGAISFLRFIAARWPLTRAEKTDWFPGGRAFFFCSNFFHLDAAAAAGGRFHSRYWGGLQGLLNARGFRTNWLQLFYPHDAVPDARTAAVWSRRFNKERQENGFHTFLDSFLSLPLLAGVAASWWRVALASARMGEVKKAFRLKDSNLDYWPLMKRYWYSSVRGPVAFNNHLVIALFDAALAAAPHQERGLYLLENQPWERAFIHAWRKHKHGKLIGVAHSTTRFWDLRNFSDARTLTSPIPHPLPEPDILAVNGLAARNAFLAVGYPSERIADSEALRYGYLAEMRGTSRTQGERHTATKVLILGDYLPAGTISMLRMLEEAAPSITAPIEFTAKPHPNYPIDPADYPGLSLKIVVQPLAEIILDYDVAYSSNMTSASVDAYLAGLPVAVMLDQTDLNFSPLRGQAGVSFVGSGAELAEVFNSLPGRDATDPVDNQFFFLDPELRRWKELLGLHAVTNP